jgi:putative alpha-1,2-mannosidase
MNLLQYVNPLQGTASNYEYSNGNTLPLVERPFGMAAWSAQTNEAGGGWSFIRRTAGFKSYGFYFIYNRRKLKRARVGQRIYRGTRT